MSENIPDDLVGRIRAAVAALNRGDVDTYAASFDPACLRWGNDTETAVPAADIAESLRQMHAAFEGFTIGEELLVGCGDHVVARWRVTGTHTGEFASIPPTGRSIDIAQAEIYQFAGDRVIATWNYGDPLALPRQLGLLGEAS
jgi:predicted ester cyclase